MKHLIPLIFCLFSLLILSGCGGTGGGGDIVDPDSTDDYTFENIDFAVIQGGSFTMGGITDYNDAPMVTVTLTEYKISRTEITNEQYVTFLNQAYEDGWVEIEHQLIWDPFGSYYNYVVVAAGNAPYPGYNMLQLAEDGGHTSLGEPEHENNKSWIAFDSEISEFYLLDDSKADWPVNWVKWHGAFTFARFYELDLPTEAQWEYAARASQGLEFATTDGLLTSNQANYNGTVADVYNPEGFVVETGSYAPNPFGLYDMSGNVWEWCLDYYDAYYYISGRINPLNLDPGNIGKRVRRGGAWNYHDETLKTFYRSSQYENVCDNNSGFRVVQND